MSLLGARDGTLWIGTAAGLDSLKDGRLVHHPEIGGGFAAALLEDREGAIWVTRIAIARGDDKVCVIRNQQPHCPAEFAGKRVVSLYQDQAGNLWAGGDEGVWRWRHGEQNFYAISPQRNGIEGFAELETGSLVFSGNFGLKRLVNDRIEPYLDSAGEFRPRRLLRDREGSLWITSMQGLVHVQGKIDRFEQKDGLSGDPSYPIFQDREGTLWVATGQGLDRFRDFAIAPVSFATGPPLGLHSAGGSRR
jgi:ligand-binding sensor domain-containing protein